MKNRRVLFSLLFIFNAFTLFAQVSPSIDVTEDGVGIGTAAPQEMLDVNGRVRDKTGIIMPIGTILSFAGRGDTVPEGWLLCDGRAMQAADYEDLYQVIGIIYGDGSTDTRVEAIINGDFNLPDLRGMFMRGVNTPETDTNEYTLVGVDRDPDEVSRLAADGETLSTGVGSAQDDAMQRITGEFFRYTATVSPLTNSATLSGVFKIGSAGTRYPSGSSGSANSRGLGFDSADSISPNHAKTSDYETRPKNIYVNYIIKY